MNPNVNPPLKPGQLYLVDGGFSTQLSKYLGSETVDGDPLWTARSLIESPDTVCRVHRDFLASRARILLTDSYQASILGASVFLNFMFVFVCVIISAHNL